MANLPEVTNNSRSPYRRIMRFLKRNFSRMRRVPRFVAVRLRNRMSPDTWQRMLDLRGLLLTTFESLPRPRYRNMPLLTIIMAAYNTEIYVREALVSLARQHHQNIEVIIIDDDSSDSTAAIVEEFCAEDPRFRLIRHSHAGLGAVRNVGTAQATGKYLAFFDSDDIVNPLFYREAIRSLERTGSDFAVGSYELLVKGTRRWAAGYIRALHRHNRYHVKLSELPSVTVSILGCAKIYRRDFYERAVAPQPEGVFFEDQLPAMRAYVRSNGFDVLHRPALQWRRRETEDAISQRVADADNLRQRVQAYRNVSDFLDENGMSDMRKERLLQILETDQLTLVQLPVASSEYFQVAQQFLKESISEVDPEKYRRRVKMPQRMLHAVILNTDHETTTSFLFAGGERMGNWVFLDSPEVGPVGRLPMWSLDQEVDVPIDARCPNAHERSTIAPWKIVSEKQWAAALESPQSAGQVFGVDTKSPRFGFQCWYWNTQAPIRSRIYMECFHGEEVTDTQLALSRELTRRGLSESVVWGTDTTQIEVPQGHQRVTIGSAEYFEALATSAVLCFNDEVPEFLVKRPEQLVIQTYQGHPFQLIGVPLWKHQHESDAKARMNLQLVQKWDVLLSPSPLATQLYQQCFPGQVEYWELGVPRNDSLVLPPDGLREQIRHTLGIADDQVALLYAPARRRPAALGPRGSRTVGTVDPKWLVKRLGNEFVILMRGHDSQAPRHPRIIDVTRYRHTSDLILASDCALFDYSSLRFDYSLTDKPMVYYAADQERVFTDTPSLWPYEDSIAGECLSERTLLPEAIMNAMANPMEWAEQRQRLRQLVAPWDDGHASERLADRVCPILESSR